MSESTRAFRHVKLRAEVEASESTALGGLSLAIGLAAKLGLPQAIDARLDLLQSRRPFHESDHVLTHAYNLFVGGTAIEDIAELQHSEPVRRMLGASRIPDPSTAGDFLRRFDAKSIGHLDRAIDEIHARAWKQHYGRKKQSWGIVDVDSHVRHVYGNQKEGADFTYKGGFGFHPLVLSLAQTQECLRLVNRPGNVASADGAAEALSDVAAAAARSIRARAGARRQRIRAPRHLRHVRARRAVLRDGVGAAE
ncbi:MAG TPA: transposase [Planctomycetota bacterium]|nr:transposase [Planctomycetota bacterium]